MTVERKRLSKSTNFYQRPKYICVSQRVLRARQVPQAFPVHLDQKDRKERLETGEIKASQDSEEKEVSKGPVGLQGETGNKARKET